MHKYMAIFTFVFKDKHKSLVSFVHIHSSYLVNGTQVSKILIDFANFLTCNPAGCFPVVFYLCEFLPAKIL